MATSAVRPNRSTDATKSATNPLEDAIQRIRWFHGEKNLNALRDEAILHTKQHHLYKARTDQLAEIHKQLQAACDTLTAPQHYEVVITHVERNGSLMVEVAGLGNGRVQIAVHPDVDPDELYVGATAWVAREGNCLLKVTGRSGRWKDLGSFERPLDGCRVLIRDREALMAIDLAKALRDVPLQKGDLIGFDRDVAGLAYALLDPSDEAHLFDENVTDDFEQLGGLQQVIARIKQTIDFLFSYPDIARRYALDCRKQGILLYGAPGNGKTRIARCVAGYLRTLFPDKPCRFMHVSGSSDYSVWFGATEAKIIERFSAARAAAREAPVVMFFDEIDAIAKRRGSDYGSGAPDRILNTFLSQLDGIVPLANVVVMAATNRVETLDEALLRPGRFEEKIEIPSPHRGAVAAILQRYLDRGQPLAAPDERIDTLIQPLLAALFAPNGSYAEVAQVKLSDGRRLPVAGRQLVSGAMLENVVRVASRRAALHEIETGAAGICGDDLARALHAEIRSAASLLSPRNVKAHVKSIPQDAQPIAVEAVPIPPADAYIRQE
jgi:SpoVK/Ycf46/Vps4 family AAA+-type ATPase